jgi:hypothetical protein
MAEPIPNVPLEACEKTSVALRKVIDSMNSQPSHRMVSRDMVVSLLESIDASMKDIAIKIQQDQSGEI